MASVKNKLKAARAAIGKRDFTTAQEVSLEILEEDPSNYNANVFLGLASLELGKRDTSEKAYLKAIQIDATSPLAWQGISQLYAQTGKWNKCAESLDSVLHIFAKSDDATKCAEALQKYVDVCKGHLGPLQVVTALALYLPSSEIYSVLSSLPPPDATNPDATTTFEAQTAIQNTLPIIQEIVQLLENYEETTFTQEVEKRRQRLGAPPPDVIRREVCYEIWRESRLPEFYHEILNHPNTSDELRRETESKLFNHKQQLMSAMPSSGEGSGRKSQVSEELEEMMNGIVLLGIPNEAVWKYYIEGQDVYSLEEYDVSVLQKFLALFPYSSFTNLILGYLAYAGIPPTTDPESQPPVTIEYEDSFDVIQDSYNDLPDSVFASRIMVNAYHDDFDYESTIKVAEDGLERTRKLESERGKSFRKTRRIFNVMLGTSLVNYYPPKHHTRALRILDDVLSDDQNNVPSLMGRAYILQAAKDWGTAAELFQRVHELLPDDVNEGIRAREEQAWCALHRGNVDAAAEELKAVSEILDDLEGRELDQARCWWRMGKCALQAGEHERAYQCFITALKRSPSFAPAFSDLGVYYLEITKPTDPNRASKCFQKAFELDATQTDAARRLAESFAEEREWDLVEVVARRTIEGEGGDEQVTSKYLPVNSWAYKALGVVELNRKNYPAAIQSLQTSLRGEPDDQVGWVRLGEAYARAGRHVAAIKALEHARTLRPDDWICSYLIADVQSQTGHFTEAITSLQTILDGHPSELGVLVALSTAYLSSGTQEMSLGFFARAEVSYLTAVEVAWKAMETNSGFSRVLWKIIADSLFRYSSIQSPGETQRLSDVLLTLKEILDAVPSNPISKPLIGSFSPEAVSPLNVLEFAVATYEYRISFGFHDDKAKASAWYDLGVALQTLRSRKGGSLATITQDQVLRCLKEAVSSDPEEEYHWIALGDAYFLNNAKSAQHAYIRALELNSKNVVTWTNLGLLYLHHQDLELANEAFLRAQVLDSTYPLAWLGQGLVASANGHESDAENIFEHIVELETTIAEADLLYAFKLFSRMAKGSQEPGIVRDSLVPAFFVLDRYCQERPNDDSALHLFGLICERVGHYDLAVELITKAISILEAKYEESEDPAIERQFTIANANISRMRVAKGDFEGALESLETALGLLGDDDGLESNVLRTQIHFVTGLSKFKSGDLSGAMESFQLAMGSVGDDLAMVGHVSVLLAQTLWSLGGDEAQESAKSQLLQCISSDSENLEAINLLAGMGILTDDDGLVDAALSEMLSLPLDHRMAMDPHHDVDGLLVKHYLGQGDVSKAFSEAQKGIFAQPTSKELRVRAASLALQNDHSVQALALLSSVGEKSEGTLAETATQLSLRAVAESLNPGERTEPLKLAQRAVNLNPASSETWSTLAFVRNATTQES